MKLLATLLPAVVVLLTLAACGSSGTSTATGSGTSLVGPPTMATGTVGTFTPPLYIPPGTKTETGTIINRLEPPPAKYRVHLTSFRSANGDIGCVILGKVARCDIAKRSWKPPARPASCPGTADFGRGLEIGRSGKARFVCSRGTVLDPAATPMPRDKSSVVGHFMCGSFMSGMWCQRLPDGAGFSISPRSYRILP